MPRAHKYDPPDSPTSVGWTEPQRLDLVSTESEPLALEAGGRLAELTVEYET